MTERYPYLKYRRLGVIVVLVSLLVCGCGKLGQTVAVWYVTQQLQAYFDLDREQKTFIKARLVEQLAHVQQHDQQGLSHLLSTVKHDVQEGVTEDTLQALYDSYKVIAFRIARRVLPDVSAFLASLSEAQLDHMLHKIADDQNAEDERHAVMSAHEQVEQRDRSVIKKVQAWTGKLSVAQRHTIVVWYHEIPSFPEWWEAYRQDQFDRFIAFLRTSPGAQHIQHELTHIWQSQGGARSQEIRDVRVKRAKAWRQFFIKTHALLTAKQRAKVVAKIEQYERRLHSFFATGDRNVTRGDTVPVVGCVYGL